MDRRTFFRRLAGRSAPVRPPYALPEEAFADACDGCGRCFNVCPTRIIVADYAERPIIDFVKGACTFCEACVEACDRGAFRPDRSTGSPWQLRARVGEACLEPKGIVCRACETSCEEAAIRFRPAAGGKTNVDITEQLCTGCGACVSACPVSALSVAPAEATAIPIKEVTS